MAINSKIEWTETTWNPVTGCGKISSGCSNCYAERMAYRLFCMGVARYKNGFDVTLQPDIIELPKSWKKPRIIFVNSMSDLFHKNVPTSYIRKVFQTMNECPQHVFQILTKRSERMLQVSSKLNWTQNIWMGVTVENNNYTSRINDLIATPAYIKFLSIEPLIGPINNLKLKGISWVIVGGESGPNARPIERKWVTDIRDLCIKKNVPFFFKQWGGINKKKNGRELDNRTWNEMPQA